MKKMMFLMLTLLVLGVASMNAQVKIGGDGTTGPVDGAVLELDGADGVLVLPRFADKTNFPTATADLKGALVYCNANDSLYTCTGTVWMPLGAGKEYGAATAADLGLIKTGTATETNISVAIDGTISVPLVTSSSSGAVTSRDYTILNTLYNSDLIRSTAGGNCTTTPSSNGLQIGSLCWAAISSKASWFTIMNGITCPSPWRVPTIAEYTAAYNASRPSASASWKDFAQTLHWSSESIDDDTARAFQFVDRSSGPRDKSNFYYVKCVRAV